jgi:hypothetical protein
MDNPDGPQLSNDHEMYVNESSASAHESQAKRVKTGSKGTYGSKRNIYTAWLKKWYQEEAFDFEKNELIYPVQTHMWVAFLGAKKTQIQKGDAVKVKFADGSLVPGLVVKGSRYDEYDVKLANANNRVLKRVSELNIVSTNYVSYENLSGYRSALGHEYSERKLVVSPDLNSETKRILDGYQREVSTMKSEGLMDAQEGKLLQ